MPLTPQEAQELAQLQAEAKQHQFAAATAPMTPDQAKELTSAVAMSMPGNLGFLKGAGKGASALAEWLGGKMAGLKAPAAQAYKAAPRTVEALVKASPARTQQFAEQALESTSNRIGSKAGEANEALMKAVDEGRIPYSKVASAEPQISEAGGRLSLDVPTATVGGRDVEEARQAIGKVGTKWSLDPLTGRISRASDPAMGEAYNTLRSAANEAIPESAPLRSKLGELVEAQKGIKAGAQHPTSFMSSAAGDIPAAREVADTAVGGTRLQRTAGQMQAAKQLQAAPEGPYQAIRQAAGKAMLRTSGVPSKVGSASDTLLSRLLGASTAAPKGGLTSEEQAELDQLNSEASQRQ